MSQILRDNLRAAFETRGTSAGTAASESGVGKSTLTDFLSGTSESLRVPTLQSLADWLGTTAGALLGEAGAPASAAIVDIRLDALHASPLNPRKTFATESLDELKDSIRTQGLLENLVVRRMVGEHHETPGPNYWIVAGERRLRALRDLALCAAIYPDHAVPCRIVEADDAQHVVLALLENVQREDVPPLEEAAGFKALVADGWGTDKIAETIGKTRRHVQLRLALLDKLAPECRAALAEGEITVEQARALTVGTFEDQQSAVANIAEGHYRWRRSEDIRERLLEDKHRVGANIFKLAEYDGAVLEDQDSARFFADNALFDHLQLAAAKSQVEDLSREWAWAELLDSHGPGMGFGHWEYDKSKDKTKAGAVVNIRYDGTVETHVGLVKKTATKPAAAAGGEVGEKSPYTKVHLELAKRVKTEALQEAVATAPATALRLAVLGLMGASGVRLGIKGFEGPGGAVAPAVVEIFNRHKAAFEGCLRPYKVTSRPLDLEYTAEAKAFAVLQAMDDATLMEILAALVAAQFGTFAGFHPALGDEPLPCTVASALAVDMGSRDLLTEDYLASCRKPQLVEIAEARGIGRAGDDDRPVDGMTAKALRARLLEVAGDGSGRLDGYVPRELRFGSTEELEKAAADYPAAPVKQVAA